MTTTTSRLPSLETFLVGAKEALRNAIVSKKRVTLVIGRDVAGNVKAFDLRIGTIIH